MNSILLHTSSGLFITFYSIIFTVIVLVILLVKFVFSILIMIMDKNPRKMRRELGQFKLISTVTLEMLVLNKMCLWNGFDFYPPVLNHTGTT